MMHVSSAASWGPWPLFGTPRMQYPCGVDVDFLDLAPALAQASAVNASERPRIAQIVDAGGHLKRALEIYRQRDKSYIGFLAWGNGEIPAFVAAVFQCFGLLPPTETQP